jgi:cation-transporting ATPase 13A1
MLIAFESTVVHQRQRNLHDVRALQQPRQPLKVYRAGRWADLPGDALVPGDLVSLARALGGGEVVVQADMLLLAGSCIVDEAVLTGESTPQWKNPVGEAVGDEADAAEVPGGARLSIKRDKMHVVFGGTKLMQATGDREAHVRAPDGGCLAVVLRTGFGTAQGAPRGGCRGGPPGAAAQQRAPLCGRPWLTAAPASLTPPYSYHLL